MDNKGRDTALAEYLKTLSHDEVLNFLRKAKRPMKKKWGDALEIPELKEAGKTTHAPASKPDKRIDRHYKRIILEYCCGENSYIGKHSDPDTYVYRLTINDDVRTEACIRKVQAFIQQYKNIPILLWASISCTGGSLWNRVNEAKNLPGFADRLNDLSCLLYTSPSPRD